MAGSPPLYTRILLKLSGEALAGGKPHGFDRPAMQAVLITRRGPADWHQQVLFETDAPALLHAQTPAAFEF